MLQKPTPEIGTINLTPGSGVSFPCRLHLSRKKLAPIYAVEINNGRRPRRSSFHPNGTTECKQIRQPIREGRFCWFLAQK